MGKATTAPPASRVLPPTSLSQATSQATTINWILVVIDDYFASGSAGSVSSPHSDSSSRPGLSVSSRFESSNLNLTGPKGFNNVWPGILAMRLGSTIDLAAAARSPTRIQVIPISHATPLRAMEGWSLLLSKRILAGHQNRIETPHSRSSTSVAMPASSRSTGMRWAFASSALTLKLLEARVGWVNSRRFYSLLQTRPSHRASRFSESESAARVAVSSPTERRTYTPPLPTSKTRLDSSCAPLRSARFSAS